MPVRRPQSVNATAGRALRFTGVKELQAELSKLVRDIGGQGLGKDIKDVNLSVAQLMADESRKRAPVDDGDLQRAHFAARGDANNPKALFGVNPKIAPHGHLVEFGHGGPKPAPPHPFIRTAIATKRSIVREMFVTGIAAIIKKYTA